MMTITYIADDGKTLNLKDILEENNNYNISALEPPNKPVIGTSNRPEVLHMITKTSKDNKSTEINNEARNDDVSF